MEMFCDRRIALDKLTACHWQRHLWGMTERLRNDTKESGKWTRGQDVVGCSISLLQSHLGNVTVTKTFGKWTRGRSTGIHGLIYVIVYSEPHGTVKSWLCYSHRFKVD
jgi:hypothetical protein